MVDKKEITEEIERYRQDSDLGKYFDEAIVGYADVFDPLFEKYKEIIGEFHMTPGEVFASKYPGEELNEGTVLCWVLPIREDTRIANAKQEKYPAKEWAHTRNFGEKENSSLRKHLESYFDKKGVKSVAPMLSNKWERIKSEEVGFASTWSERHAAFAAGLGTFGLCDGFITEAGKAHRCGSIIIDVKLTPGERPYKDPYENCLFSQEEKCGVCMKKCPAGAITKSGHDKDICHGYIRKTLMPAVNEKYGVEIPGCGLCQVKVPCETKNPRS